jgi:hypothetical protein
MKFLRLEPLLDRVEQLERAMGDQTASIEAVRHRAAETAANMQRLIASIEGLSDRMRPPVLLPFEMQLSEAAHRQTTEEPRVRVIKESEPKRSRFPLARVFPLFLAASLPRVFPWP